MKICIDPGHGGKDPGAVGYDVKEKDITLGISLLLAEILKKKGITVDLTRTSDIYHSVNEKAQIANSKGADLFISIHCNSAGSTAAEGAEVLIYDDTCSEVAECVKDSLIGNLGLRDRGVKIRKDLAVLNSTTMPAILVETAFLSNARERNLLLNNKREFAQAIAEGIFKFYGMEDKEMVEESKMIVNNKEVTVRRILKDGTNYIAVRDIADSLGYEIGNQGSIAVLNKK